MKLRLGLLVLNATLVGAMAISVAACNKPQDPPAQPKPTTSVGTEYDDSVVTGKVKSALLADPDVKSFDFKVETNKGEVQLSGFVDTQAQIDKANALARGVAGVKNVDNKVSLKGTPSTAGSTVDDGMVTAKVKTALLEDATVKSFDISVVTLKGEVQLSGFVDNQAQIDRAISIAKGVNGVRAVINKMSVKK